MSTLSNNSDNETFLSDWLAGNISDDQLKVLVSESDFAAYEKLRFSLRAYEIVQPDMDKNFKAIQQKIADHKNPRKSKKISMYPIMAVAATLLLFFGLYSFFVFSNTFQTDYGKIADLVLKDRSEVTLNAQSKITYPTLFQWNRTLKLEGEAYFKVAKGSTFCIETTEGKVEVLGTQFNVIARPDFFEVTCFEGKVKVTSAKEAFVLTPGKSVRIYQNTIENWQENRGKPSWISGESTFRNMPLQIVIDQLENQYQYEVEFPKTLTSIRFTGSFTHQNINTALQSICLPMHLHYSKTVDGKILIAE